MLNATDDIKEGADGNQENAGAGGGDGSTKHPIPEAKAPGEETITVKKSEFEKIQSDRDNYRAGLLKKKADERSLDNKNKDAGAGSIAIDEAKIAEIAKAQATAAFAETYKSNENRAKILITKKYGELVDDANWVGFMSHFNGRRGRATVEDILDDFEDTMLLYKRSTGKLDEHLKSEHERGVREGRIQGELGSGRGTGGAGDRNEALRSTGILTPKGEEMARAMHVNPEKVKKVDLSKDNVIDVTK